MYLHSEYLEPRESPIFTSHKKEKGCYNNVHIQHRVKDIECYSANNIFDFRVTGSR